MMWIARLNAPDTKASRRYLWSEKHEIVSILEYNKIGYYTGGHRTLKVDARLDWKTYRKQGWIVNIRKHDADDNATTAIQLEIQSIRKLLNDLAR